MSEQPVTGRGAPAKGGKKIFGLPRTTVIIGGVALAAGVAYFLYKRKSSSSAASTTAADTAGQSGTACTDQNGNPGYLDANGDCETTDQSGSIAALQTELEDLQQAQAGTSASTTSSTSTSAPPRPGPVRVKSKSATSVTVTWNAVTGATGYDVQVTHQGAKVASGNRSGNTDNQLTVGGLKRNTSYEVSVAAVGPGGTSAYSTKTHFYTSK